MYDTEQLDSRFLCSVILMYGLLHVASSVLGIVDFCCQIFKSFMFSLLPLLILELYVLRYGLLVRNLWFSYFVSVY
jgi:hypothetical protein